MKMPATAPILAATMLAACGGTANDERTGAETTASKRPADSSGRHSPQALDSTTSEVDPATPAEGGTRPDSGQALDTTTDRVDPATPAEIAAEAARSQTQPATPQAD